MKKIDKLKVKASSGKKNRSRGGAKLIKGNLSADYYWPSRSGKTNSRVSKIRVGFSHEDRGKSNRKLSDCGCCIRQAFGKAKANKKLATNVIKRRVKGRAKSTGGVVNVTIGRGTGRSKSYRVKHNKKIMVKVVISSLMRTFFQVWVSFKK